MAEDSDRDRKSEMRVVARKQAGGTGDELRRVFQRHLWLFLGVNGPVLAIDLMSGPGIQFWHWLGFFWGVFLVIHMGGLLSRGFSIAELLLPPRSVSAIADDAPPLEYELVKTRQLRDGVVRAARAVREREPQRVDAAVERAEEIERVVVAIVTAAREAGRVEDDDALGRIEAELEETLVRLDELHAGLIRAAVDGAPLDEALPLEAAGEQLERLKETRARFRGDSAG